MRCPNCKRDNRPGNRYCIYCGASLAASGADEIREGLQAADEVKRLRELVARMNDRLSALERAQGIIIPSEEQVPAAEAEQVAAVPAPEEPPVEAVEVPAPEEPLVEAVEVPAPEEPPIEVVEVPEPVAEKRQPTAIEREWEQILGGNWLARIGVLSLIIGAGFFLKFAFDRAWLGPTGRVILGIVAGLVMLAGGHYWRRKYPIFAQTISGGGIALLYLSIFAAFTMFNLIDFYLAVALLFIISAASAVLALRYNSMALAIIGIIGAFIAPFILAVSTATVAGGAGTTHSIWLLVYIMVVDIGVLWLSTFRNWRWFTLLALVGSLAVFGVWYNRFGNDFNLFTSQGSLTIIFLIFVGATMLYHVLWRRIPQAFDYSLMVINATAYYGISYALLRDDLRVWLGGFSFLLALFYGGLSYLASKRGAVNERLASFALGIALLFLTIAIPVQLGDKAWTTIAWAAQGTILMWLSLRLRLPYLRAGSYIVFIATAVRLLYFDTTINIETFTPVLNERFLAFIVSIAAMYLTGYLLWKKSDNLTEWEKEYGYNYRIFLVAANLFTLWIIGAEVISYWDAAIPPEEDWQLIFLVILAGITTLYHTIWRRPAETFAQTLLVIDAVFYFGISAFIWGDLRDWMGSLYFVLALFHGGLAYYTSRRGTEYSKFTILAISTALLFFTVAVPVQLGDKAWTTVIWAAEASALMWLSFRLRRPELRVASYIVFIALIIRLLFFDATVNMRTFTPVLNERFLAFIVSVAAMYLSSYILWLKRDALTEWEKTRLSIYPVFLVAANFFTILLLSMEVWGFFSREISTAASSEDTRHLISGLRSARNLSLTALWAVYAVVLLVIGMTKRLRPLRLAGLGLLVIPIVKVYVYDVFELEQVYRIVAFVGLGILLTVSGYLYQRYKGAIKEFIVEK